MCHPVLRVKTRRALIRSAITNPPGHWGGWTLSLKYLLRHLWQTGRCFSAAIHAKKVTGCDKLNVAEFFQSKELSTSKTSREFLNRVQFPKCDPFSPPSFTDINSYRPAHSCPRRGVGHSMLRSSGVKFTAFHTPTRRERKNRDDEQRVRNGRWVGWNMFHIYTLGETTYTMLGAVFSVK